MKNRKEFIIFGVVMIAFVIGLVITRVDFSGRKSYSRDDVMLDFGSDARQEVTDTPENSELDGLGDFTGEPADTVPDDTEVIVPDVDGESVGYQGAQTEVVDDGLSPKEDITWDEEPTETTDVPSGVGDTVDVEGTPSELSSEQYAYMLTYYVCGLEDDLFERWLTPELLGQFNTHSDEEPYKSLSGNLSFADVVLSGDSFSFKDKDGTLWKFRVGFDGDRVSSIEYVQ